MFKMWTYIFYMQIEWLPKILFRKEHSLLRNVYKRQVLAKLDSLKSLGNDYTTFKLFVKISFLLYDLYDATSNIDCIKHTEIDFFCSNYCSNCESFEEIFEATEKIQIKNFINKIFVKKLWQKTALAYMKIMKFPSMQFFIPNIATKNFFESINNITEGEIYLHYSRIMGQIIGYIHRFAF